MRIVAHTCSNTELVCALGRADWLVGVDEHSDFPPEVVAGLPRVGKDLELDPAAVAALRPDLVLTSLTVPGHERVVAALAAAKLPMLVLAPSSAAGVAQDLRLLGRVLGVPERGEALAQELEEALAPHPLPPDAPRLLVEWWPRPVIAAGRQSWVDDLLRAAGARNALGEREVQSAPLTDAEVQALDPDAVVISWCGVPESHYRPDVVLRRPGWQDLRLVQARQVYAVHESLLGRPGPRLVQGLAALRAVVAAVRAQRGR